MSAKTTRLGMVVGASLLGLVLAGCGGGGGGGGEAVTWNGADTPAVMDTADPAAWALAMWEGTEPPIWEDMLFFVSAPKESPDSWMDIPSSPGRLPAYFRGLLARAPRGPVASPQAYGPADTEVLYGNVSGTIRLTARLDYETGTYYVTAVAEGYADTSDGSLQEADGAYIFEGTIEEFDVIFRDFNLASADPLDTYDFLYDGTFSFNYSSTSTTETYHVGMDLAFEDHLADTAFWFHDFAYTHVLDYSDSTATDSGSGRVYFGDEGYVDILVSPDLVYGFGDDYPREGAVRITGADGRWAKITFIDAGTYRVTACTDGDGTAEFDSSDLYWP